MRSPVEQRKSVAGAPPWNVTTRLVARAIGVSGDVLKESFQPLPYCALPALIALRKAALGNEIAWDDPAYLHWRYRFDDGQGGRIGTGPGECWGFMHDGRLLGAIGTHCMPLRVGAAVVPVLSLMDIMVLPEIDGAGLGLWMTMRLLQTDDCIAIGSNPKSLKLVSRFTRLPDRRSYVAPVDPGDYLRRRIANPRLANIGATVTRATMRTWRMLALHHWDPRIRVQRVSEFDASFTALLAAPFCAGTVHAPRRVEDLDWRLFQNPRMRYTVLAARSGDTLLGYIAIQHADLARGRTAIVVVDWMLSAIAPRRAFAILLREVLRTAYRERCASVMVTAYHPQSEQWFKQAGFMLRKNEFETVAVSFLDERLQAAVAAKTDWYLTEIDTDRDGF